MAEVTVDAAASVARDGARKRIRRSHVAFVLGALAQYLPIAAGALARPPVTIFFVIMLLGGYCTWGAYLVFTPMWRRLWREERPSGCSVATLIGMTASFLVILWLSYCVVGPLGGGIWQYTRLRRSLRSQSNRFGEDDR
jgi:hypothetical protein